MSGRVALRVGPENVGQRVVLRRAVAGGRYVDVLGDLLSWADGVVRVRTRTGESAVPITQVIAGKPVPPPPTRRGSPNLTLGVEALEDVAADGWRPLELAWIGVPGRGWRLRAAAGFTGRANSALTTGDPGLPVPQAISVAEAWYVERGLTPRFALPWALDAAVRRGGADTGARESSLDDALRQRGYQLDTPTLVLTAATRQVAAAAVRPGAAPLGAGLRVDLADSPDEAWLAVYRYRGSPLPPVARQLLMSAPAQVFVSVREGERTVAVGRGASSRGWTGVSAMQVEQSHQRRGLGRELLGAIAGWALQRGDRSMYLQVAEANEAARRVYGVVGFAAHHGYHYRLRPAPTP